MRAGILPALTLTLAGLLGGFATVYDLPGNVPLGEALTDNDFGREVPNFDDDVLLALSFSGGGTRAAAFSLGVLTELERSRAGSNKAKSLLDRVELISGVSGGWVTAAYFGLKKRAALDDFPELSCCEMRRKASIPAFRSAVSLRPLVGASTTASLPLGSISTSLTVRGSTLFAKTVGRGSGSMPPTSITAHRSCSEGPLSTPFAVISGPIVSPKRSQPPPAVPLAFAPIVLETFPGGCSKQLPPLLERARHDPQAQPLLRSFAEANARYRDGSMRFCEAARRRPRRQFRPVRVQHRADGGAAAVRADDRTAGGEGAAHHVPRGRRRPWHLRRLRAAARGAERHRTGLRRGFHRDRRQCAAELRGVFLAAQRMVGQGELWRCGLSATERARLGVGRTGVAATSPSSSTGSASTSSARRAPASSRRSRRDLYCRRTRSTS